MQSQQPLTLSCGLRLPNRIVKAAMAEQLADASGLPNERHFGVYKNWAEGGFGMVITGKINSDDHYQRNRLLLTILSIGNVQIDPRYLGAPGDVFLPSTSSSAASKDALLTAWKSYAQACTNNNTISIVQINHPGRQSPLGAGSRGIFAKSIAPSAIPLDFNGGIVGDVIQKVMFGCPRAMSKDEIAEVVSRFAQTAVLAEEAGFHGCEIHAAHGYLLSQFMSAKTNVREDEYGGSAANRVRIVVEIIRAIREKVPKNFAVGVKLNSVDQQGEEMKDRLEQLRLLKETGGLDFIEVSGGTYESPTVRCVFLLQSARLTPCLFTSDEHRPSRYRDSKPIRPHKSPRSLLPLFRRHDKVPASQPPPPSNRWLPKSRRDGERPSTRRLRPRRDSETSGPESSTPIKRHLQRSGADCGGEIVRSKNEDAVVPELFESQSGRGKF